LLAKQVELARIDEAREGSLIQVVDPAYPPDKRSFPHRSLIVLAAAAAGLFLGLLAALVHARLQRMSSDPHAQSILAQIRTAVARREQKL
jgi:uncharacterized protein involved in exopolysaccharide biosynthesis